MIRAYMLQPAVVFQARVNAATFDYPIMQVAFDGVTVGSFGAIAVGQTILFGSTAGGDDRGRQRVRKPATSDTLYFGRSSQGTRDGEVDLADNAWITVVNLHQVWSKIPYIDPDGAIFKDGEIAYVDQNKFPPPISNAGAPAAGTIDSITGKLRVTLPHTANTSFAVANGASLTSYLWALPGGVTLVGGYALTDSQIQVDCDPGFHYIALTATDSNARAHTSRTFVYARNPAADTTIQNFQITSHQITQAGQRVSIKVLDPIPASTYIDGTLVVLFDGEMSGPADRSNLLFWGFHHLDPADISAQRTGTLKDTTLELLDVAGKLDTLPGFPQSIENNDAPTSWLQMAQACVDRYLAYLLFWHSTALDLADWTWSGTGATYAFVVLSSDGASLWQQAAQRARSMVPNHILTANTLGQLRTLPDPLLLDLGVRPSTVQAALTAADWTSLRFTHQRPARGHWLRGNAILAHPTEINAVFCIAPGDAPAQGEASVEQGQQLSPSQDALNRQEGHRYARLNAPESHFDITLAGSEDLDIEPASLAWVTLTLPAELAAQRGLAFTAARGLVHSLDIRYEHGRTGLVRTVGMTWERETEGSEAVTEPVAKDKLPPIEFDPPPTIYDPTPAPEPASDLGMKTVYVMDGLSLYRTLTFDAGSPAWASIGPTRLSGERFKDFVLDPWRPGTSGYIASDQGVYRSEDLDAASPSWTQVMNEADMIAATGADSDSSSAAKLLASSNADGFLAYFYVSGLSKAICARSFDRGATWSHVQAMPTSSFFLASEAGAVDIVPHSVGGQLVFYIANGFTDRLHKSTDSGATWSVAGVFPDNVGPARAVHCPWADNEDGQTVYMGFSVHGSGTPKGRVYKSTDGGASFTTISPITDRGLQVRRTGIEASLLASQSLYCMVERLVGDAGNTLWTSDDGGSSWTQRAAAGYTATQTPVATSGFPYDEGRLYLMTANAVRVSLDRGETFINKLGTGITTPMSPVASNGGVIVPDWSV